MKNKIILLLVLLLPIFAFSQDKAKDNSTKLSIDEVNKIGNSLVEQQFLTVFGKEELIRYATSKPLLIYKEYNEQQLDSVNCNQYLLEEYFDILPGRENKNKEYLSLLEDQKNNDDKILLAAGQKFLNSNFPTRTHLFDFLFTSISFHLYDGHQDYDSTTTKIAKSFGNYFEPKVNVAMQDTLIEFEVSYDKDTKILQNERVKIAKPFLKWIPIFKTAGLLKSSEMSIENRYANGENIFSSINSHSIIKEIKEIIHHNDLVPFYRIKQTELLDKLVATNFLTSENKTSIISNYNENEFLNPENIVASTNHFFALNRKLEIAPYSLMTWNNYGEIEPTAIKKVYEMVLQKAAKLLNFTYSNLEVHRIAATNYKQLIVLPNNRQYYVLVKINNVLYKESIKELEGKDWIRAQNFQFLNHFLEDQNDNRRFFITSQKRITGYEPQEPDNLYFTLLKEKEETIFRNKYLFADIDDCYAGEPGDYQYYVGYDFFNNQFDSKTRFDRNSLVNFIKLCKELKLSNAVNQEINYTCAFFRDLNPFNANSILSFFPEAFALDKTQQTGEFLMQLENQLQEIQPSKMSYFKDYLQEYKLDKATNQEKLVTSFKFMGKPIRISVDNEDEFWTNNLLLNLINKTYQDANLPFKIYLFKNESEYGGSISCILLTFDQKTMLDKMYPKMFVCCDE